MLSKYFSSKEMACSGENCCGHSSPMDSLFLTLLDRVREESGGAIKVNSGFRCKIHNAEVGGVETSLHTKGRAADCVAARCSLKELEQIAKMYFKEVIRYATFVHIGLE